jgi:hypothetical protein
MLDTPLVICAEPAVANAKMKIPINSPFILIGLVNYGVNIALDHFYFEIFKMAPSENDLRHTKSSFLKSIGDWMINSILAYKSIHSEASAIRTLTK